MRYVFQVLRAKTYIDLTIIIVYNRKKLMNLSPRIFPKNLLGFQIILGEGLYYDVEYSDHSVHTMNFIDLTIHFIYNV